MKEAPGLPQFASGQKRYWRPVRIRVGSGLFPISVPTASVAELTFAGQVVIAQTFKVFEVWAIVGALYLVLILSILAAAKRLERGLGWSALPEPSGAT